MRAGAPADTLHGVSCCPAVGFVNLPEPLRGSWPARDQHGALSFPDTIAIGGHAFKRSTTWAAPYSGVVAQYREDVDRKAMHLMVHSDGTWIVDHVDEANPERGLVLEHTLKDVIHTPWGAALLALGVVGLVAGISYAVTR